MHGEWSVENKKIITSYNSCMRNWNSIHTFGEIKSTKNCKAGHLQRMKEKELLKEKPRTDQVEQGRPRKRWLDNVENNLGR